MDGKHSPPTLSGVSRQERTPSHNGPEYVGYDGCSRGIHFRPAYKALASQRKNTDVTLK